MAGDGQVIQDSGISVSSLPHVPGRQHPPVQQLPGDQAGHRDGTGRVEVRVVLLGRGPVEVPLGLLDPELLPQRDRQGLDVEQRDAFLGGERPYGGRVLLVGRHGVAARVELPPLDRGGQHRPRAPGPSALDVQPQVVLVRRPRLGVPGRVLGLLVVVPELDEQEVTGLDQPEDRIQPSLVDEGLGTPPVHRVVGHGQVLAEEEGKRHAPPGLGSGVGVLLRGGGVARDVERACSAGSGLSGTGRRESDGHGTERRHGDLSTSQ